MIDMYAQDTLTTSKLPIIFINTNGQQIPDEERIVVDMGIIYNGVGNINHIDDRFNNYDGKVSIETRGSSSQAYPKKSYSFETQDEDGNNLNVSLIDLPAENDWVLYAPYCDKSLMRNVLTYDLSREFGHYAPRTKFCELVLNNEYIGVYVLIEKIKRDDNRVAISELGATDTVGNNVTGGYIIKRDSFTGGGAGWTSAYSDSVTYQYHYPKNTHDVLKGFNKLLVCELNNGQFANYLRLNFQDLEFMQYNKIQGLPFTVIELKEKCISVLEEK